MKQMKRILLYPLVVLFILFEELIYRHFIQPIFARIKLTHVVQYINGFISRQNRYTILILFMSFFVIGELLGLISFALLASGLFFLGILAYSIKTLLALYAFILLETQKTKLFSFSWFAYAYTRTLQFIHYIQATSVYQEIHLLFAKTKRLLKLIRHKRGLLLRLYRQTQLRRSKAHH
ncbi:MAG: hypothetical protein K0U21_06155 [Proteobacteria bacterium]|nr:hypothetical protein [Pseudomonadota bacterium]